QRWHKWIERHLQLNQRRQSVNAFAKVDRLQIHIHLIDWPVPLSHALSARSTAGNWDSATFSHSACPLGSSVLSSMRESGITAGNDSFAKLLRFSGVDNAPL